MRKIYTALVAAGAVACLGFGTYQIPAFASNPVSDTGVRASEGFILWTPYYIRAQFRGYRIYPKGDRAYYKSLGLAIGDRVIAIDGQNLTDAESAIQLVRKISKGASAILTVQRDGLTEDIEIPAR